LRVYTELIVWQKSHKLVLEVFKLTTNFPKDERYGLTSQIRRAAASVPGNIAEGCAKESNKDFSRFLQISLGSANEL
jgi:four helix bundle protein